MKIIDIRARRIPDSELLKESHARFHLDIKEIPKEEVKKIPPYGLEIGKKEKTSWLKGIKQVSFAFTTHLGLKKYYRIKTSFLLPCLLVLVLFTSVKGIGTSLTLTNDLFQKGGAFVEETSAQNLFAASLAVKEVRKALSSLGEVPKLVSEKFEALDFGSAWAEFFLRVSGYYNPRYYLLLFQNNSEMRPTGGFIGSYALIKVDQGNVEIKKVEGIFNISGQQRLHVIPPEPIQKISTSWQLHDANWFFDFPTSAKAIAWLYEKSEGPTVDGIIAITPELLSTLLTLTGPIPLEQFQNTLSAQNFIDLLQYEVELNYKERGLKDPKEIVAYATPLVLERITRLPRETLFSTLLESIEKKEILLYFARPEEEAFMEYLGWGGAITHHEGDYLAIVNSNINGFKTDRMIIQQVKHQSEILSDGSIKDTVVITREHKGGKSEYDWYNRVNADFLRVYVPKGSLLLEARGHTLEFTDPPIDYQASRYKEYPALKKIAESKVIEEKTGTRIVEENGKTVFGNWVYVSPGERVELTYQYLLPFKIERQNGVASLFLTVQKQPGITYELEKRIFLALNQAILWEAPTPPLIDRDRIYAWIFSF